MGGGRVGSPKGKEHAPNRVRRGEEGDHLAPRAAVVADEDIEGIGTTEPSCRLQALVPTPELLERLGVPVPTEAWPSEVCAGSKPPAALPGPAPAELMQRFVVAGESLARSIDSLSEAELPADWGKKVPNGRTSVLDALRFYPFHETYHYLSLGADRSPAAADRTAGNHLRAAATSAPLVASPARNRASSPARHTTSARRPRRAGSTCAVAEELD
jgi:hypothetical protein